ncbi:RimK/LysX family protein [Agaribacterium sp. ZY112]|uniref:putative ATP-dependent zinc protease n=1 Tax=Agaribacterium sp. ZY112 TaxID=3233574 RepID=UPI003526080C
MSLLLISGTYRYRSFLVWGFLLGLAACSWPSVKEVHEPEPLKSSAELEPELSAEILALKQGQLELNQLITELALNLESLNSSKQLSNQADAESAVTEPSASVEVDTELEFSKLVLGRSEWLWLSGARRYFPAQLDTASELSLLCVDNLTSFERNGEPWLRFDLEFDQKVSSIELAQFGSVKYKHLGFSKKKKVPVVLIPVELADVQENIKFMLVSAKDKASHVVLGRNFLTDIAVVDVAQKHVLKRKPAYLTLEAQALQENSLREQSKQEAAQSISNEAQ